MDRREILSALQSADGPLFERGDVLYDVNNEEFGYIFGSYLGDSEEPTYFVRHGYIDLTWGQSKLLGRIALGDLKVAFEENLIAHEDAEDEEVPF